MSGKTERRGRRSLEEIAAEWLAHIEPRVSGGDLTSCVDRMGRLIVPFFENRIENITAARIEDFETARLRVVSPATVKKEKGVLRRFVKWASSPSRRYLDPVEVPNPPKGARGVRAIHRERVDLTPAQAEAIIAALPERSRHGKPIRALFEMFWITGLRREGVERLRVPENYEPGRGVLFITEDVDKNSYGREIELPVRLRRMLDEIVDGPGLIFGRYNYTKTLRASARKVAKDIGLTDREVETLDARDFRHAVATDSADKSLRGTAYLLGHRDLRTTSRYVHPGRADAREIMRARFGADCFDESGEPGHATWPRDAIEIPDGFITGENHLRTRQDSNLRLLPPEGSALSN